MGYLSYFLKGRVFFHEHILYLFLTVVKDAQFFFSAGIVIFSTTQKQFCAQVCVLDTGKKQTVEELHNVCCRAVYPLLQIFIYDNKAICIQVQLAVI